MNGTSKKKIWGIFSFIDVLKKKISFIALFFGKRKLQKLLEK